jgi:hypothetical protein
MSKRLWLRIAQVVLASVFITAGVLKILEPQAFASSVATFRVIPRAWSNFVAITLPPLEVFCGALLFVKTWRRAAAAGMILLNTLFILLLTQGLIRGISMECGCFGKWDPVAGHPGIAIARDFLLLSASLLCYHSFRSNADNQTGEFKQDPVITEA